MKAKWFLVSALVVVALAGLAQRKGAWVDEIVIMREPVTARIILNLEAGDYDIGAVTLCDSNIYHRFFFGAENLKGYHHFGVFCCLFMNHSGDQPFFKDGRLNPFGVPAIREAMHWIIDREYIAKEIMDGSIPRYSYLSQWSPDGSQRYPDLMAELKEKYDFDFGWGAATIIREMRKLGAEGVQGKWAFKGDTIVLRFLIPSESDLLFVGGYIADQLEKVGFRVIRDIRPTAELIPLLLSSDPRDGLWHLYVGDWVSAAVPREMNAGFNYFHTERVLAYPLFQALATKSTDPVLYEAADKLYRSDYNSMAERRELFKEALYRSNAYANIIWLVDRLGFSPVRSSVALAVDVAGGVLGSQLWAHTAQFQRNGRPVAGGSLRVAIQNLFVEPWNPIAGSNSVYDTFPIRATGEDGVATDTRDGLVWPLHIEKAEVQVLKGLPVAQNPGHDWCTLLFVNEIKVPADAWYDWDAVAQKFITVEEKFPEGTTAKRMSRVYYPESLYDVPLHDGSKISIGDFILRIILTFDRAKPESPIYDEAAVSGYKSFMTSFKGVKIVCTNPLVIETYSDTYALDAERCVDTWFPYYAQGPGFWHTLALGILAEANKELAFSNGKSALLKVEWMDYTKGPSLRILAKHLEQAVLTAYVPYTPTLGKYITQDEAVTRWANLYNWYTKMGHLWVASGPFYLDRVFPTEKQIVLKRFGNYPFAADRFQFLAQFRW